MTSSRCLARRFGVCVLLALLGQAEVVPAARPQPPAGKQGIADALVALDRGIELLEDPGADASAVLKQAIAAVSLDQVRTDLRRFLTRMPAPGPDLRCDPAFIRYRAQKELQRMRAGLLSGGVTAAEPQGCYAIPYALDLSRPLEGRRVLDIYGYDFDTVPLHLFLVDEDHYEDVTGALAVRTHSHLTVDLEHPSLALSARSRMIGLAWGNLIHHTIAVLQPTTPLCQLRVDEIPEGTTLDYEPTATSRTGTGAPRAIRVRASATLDFVSNEVDALMCATGRAAGPERTVFTGCSTQFLATIDPDRTIEGILGEVRSTVSYTLAGSAAATRAGRPREPVGRWTFTAAGGSTADLGPRVSVRFNRVRVISSETSGCVSPIAAREAWRTNALGPASLAALRPTLERTPPGDGDRQAALRSAVALKSKEAWG